MKKAEGSRRVAAVSVGRQKAEVQEFRSSVGKAIDILPCPPCLPCLPEDEGRRTLPMAVIIEMSYKRAERSICCRSAIISIPL
jgi:hypothetical protein